MKLIVGIITVFVCVLGGYAAMGGKLGVLCVGDSPARARELYDETVAILDREAQRDPGA